MRIPGSKQIHFHIVIFGFYFLMSHFLKRGRSFEGDVNTRFIA